MINILREVSNLSQREAQVGVFVRQHSRRKYWDDWSAADFQDSLDILSDETEEATRYIAFLEAQIKALEETIDLKSLREDEPSKEEFVALALFGEKIKVIGLRTDGTYRFLDDAQNVHNIIYVLSAET